MSASEPVVAVRLEIVVELGELPQFWFVTGSNEDGVELHRWLERPETRAALLDLVADVTGPSEVRLRERSRPRRRRCRNCSTCARSATSSA